MADSLNIQNNLDKEGCINVFEYCTQNNILNSYKRSTCIQNLVWKMITKF